MTIEGSKPAPSYQLPLTKNQLRATNLANGRAWKTQWRAMSMAAATVWPRLHPEDLARSEGDFHKLAGVIQQRYQLSREESNRQVLAFFDRHPSPA